MMFGMLVLQSVVAVAVHVLASKWIERKNEVASRTINEEWSKYHAPGDGAIKAQILDNCSTECICIRAGEVLSLIGVAYTLSTFL
jgi:hypothetical protein